MMNKKDDAPQTAAMKATDRDYLVGWSERWADPEIQAAAKTKNLLWVGLGWAIALILPIGFFVAARFMGELKLVDALLIGLSLAVVLLAINLIYIKTGKNRTWEGVITDKFTRQRKADNAVDEAEREAPEMEFVLMVKKTNGKIKPLIYLNRREMYDYFAIGDRIRCHCALSTYEKYDKSRDSIIYCNVCAAPNPITNDRCVRCHKPLLK
jgi:hypothetical protein